MHTVRKHILQILKETEGATVAELADQLGMAPVSVRHHLDILQGDNLICIDRVVRKGSVGRPQQLYVLTDEASGYFPNNFAALAGNLARQLKQVLPPDQVQCAFRAMAHEIERLLATPTMRPCFPVKSFIVCWHPARDGPELKGVYRPRLGPRFWPDR